MQELVSSGINGQTYLEKFLKTEELEDITGTSEITNFFQGSNVLVTGGSGFLGKVLIEKLLRSCPKMGKLYMLIRPKKGMDPDQRLKEIFENILFDRLKKVNPHYADHIVVIEGDTSQEDLGLSPENRALLIENTNVVFNAAASIRFDEEFRKAINVNVRSVKMMLLLAKEMKSLKSFVHVSTAYSHTNRKRIDEVFYKPGIEFDRLMKLTELEFLDDEALEMIRPKLLKDWPNTYSFTKSLGEEALRLYGRDLPVCLVRPSVCISTAVEPIRGWSDCLYSVTGLIVGVYVSLIRVMLVHGEKVAEIIPMDYVSNTMICASWDTFNCWNKKSENSETDPIVFNSVTSAQNPITWEEFMNKNMKLREELPSCMSIWFSMITFARNEFQYHIYKIFLHLLPGAIMDALAVISGQKPRLLDAYKKIHKFGGMMSWVSLNEWTFKNDNVIRLWKNMNPVDRKKFNCNVETIDWDEYCWYQMRGMRVYTLKDPMSTLKQGRTRYQIFKVAHYSVVALICVFLAWCIILLTRLFSNIF